VVRSSGHRTRSHVLGRPMRYRVSNLPGCVIKRDSTNTLVICVASVGITSVAIQIAVSGIVRCKDRFAERALNEGLIDDEAESAVVRVRSKFV
jgi:hypothetical protein